MLSNCFSATSFESWPFSENENVSKVISFQTGVVSGVSGSALSTIRTTRVLCTVSGPRPDKNNATIGEIGSLYCNLKFAPFTITMADQDLASLESKLSQEVRDAILPSIRLECYPKACIDVHFVILSSDGNEIPAAVMAASLALVDSSIEVSDLVSSVRVAVSTDEEASSTLEFYPSFINRCPSNDIMTFSIMSSSGSITQVQLTGTLSSNQVTTITKKLKVVAQDAKNVMARSLEKP